MLKRQHDEMSAARIRIKNRFKFAVSTTSHVREDLMPGHKLFNDSGLTKLFPLAKLVLIAVLISIQAHASLSWASVVVNETQLKHHAKQVGPLGENFGATSSHRDITTTADDKHGPKPPRGYCVRISRAIKPTSRCYKHLVQPTSVHQNKLNKRSGQQRQTAHPTHDSTQATVSVGENVDNRRQQTHIREMGAKSKSNTRRHEELVYVRSETLGDKITNLSTQAINEHLINGLLDRLMGHECRGSNTAVGCNDANDEEFRMQNMGSLTSECRSGIEKFLCRLVYPSCHFRSIDVVALVRPPCREDCLLLREHICASLNWTQISKTVQRAFKTTLMSTINALDLLVDGDPSVALAETLPFKHNDDTKGNTSDRHHQHQRQDANHASGLPFDLSALNHNIGASIHFYWPHERSIEQCESLPALWPPANVGADFGRQTNPSSSEESALKVEQFRRWLQDHRTRSYWPVCSNAHLTETNEIDHFGSSDASLTSGKASMQPNGAQ